MLRYVFFLLVFTFLFFTLFPITGSSYVYAQQYRSQAVATVAVGNPPPPGTGQGAPASNDTCSQYQVSPDPFQRLLYQRYLLNFQNNLVFGPPKNFGDPVCDYTKNKLASLIKETDAAMGRSKDDYCWYNVIVQNETSYDPNDEQLNDPLDPQHAWGNFQMGRGKNGTLDHGDVDWQTQVSNALNYNKKLGYTFAYWGTVRYDPAACTP